MIDNVSFKLDRVRRHGNCHFQELMCYIYTQSNRLLAVVGPVGSGKVCCSLVDYSNSSSPPYITTVVITTTVSTERTTTIGWISRH